MPEDSGESVRISWRRIVAEGVAIVVSILLAFGIQASWDARTDRQEAHSALETLLAEFRQHGEDLDENLENHQTILSSGLRLLSFTGDSLSVPPAQVVDSLLNLVFMYATSFNGAGGAHDALIASGRLGAVRNEELRALLSSWPGFVDDSAEDEEFVLRDVQERYTPFLNSRVATRNIFATDALGLDLPQRAGYGDYSGLLGDLEFDNLVSYRVYSERIMILDNERLRTSIDRIISLIESEL
jgi:hypothetical protein